LGQARGGFGIVGEKDNSSRGIEPHGGTRNLPWGICPREEERAAFKRGYTRETDPIGAKNPRGGGEKPKAKGGFPNHGEQVCRRGETIFP